MHKYVCHYINNFLRICNSLRNIVLTFLLLRDNVIKNSSECINIQLMFGEKL